MSKKVLSILLTAAILLTSTLFSGLVVSAENTTWAVGDKPYAVNGKDSGVEVYKASTATFYDDFMVPGAWNFESVSDVATLQSDKAIYLNNEKKTAIKNSGGIEYVWMDLSTETEGVNENAYGGSGNSIKFTTTNIVGVKHMDGTYYNAIKRNASSFDCTAFPSFDDIAVAFWVKTEGAAQFSTAFWDTSITENNEKLYSEHVKVSEAGEYIIVIPLSNFQVSNATYKKNQNISTFKMFNFELMFKALGLTSGETADIYIDNIGIYAIKPNFGKATHSQAAYVKESFDSYKNSETAKSIIDNNTGFTWTSSDGAASSFSVVEHNGGNALCYQASNYIYVAPGTEFKGGTVNSFIENDNGYIIRLNQDDTNLNVLGENATLAFWVKASRATRIVLKTNNSSGSGWVSSEEIHIPAGESIVKIPVSKIIEQDSNFIYFKKINILFAAEIATTSTIVQRAGTFMIDDIAIEPTFVAGDVTGDKIADICDIVNANNALTAAPADITAYDVYADSALDANDVRMLRYNSLGHVSKLPLTAVKITEDSFSATHPAFKNWVNSSAPSFSESQNALFYHSGDADTSAFVIDYANITAGSGSKIHYNAGLTNPYGSDGVFGFWVYSEQSVNLRCNYMDDSAATGKLQGCKWVTKTIPAGESFVTFDMESLIPAGTTEYPDYKMQYNRVYQFQINVWSNSDTENTSGTLYLDSFGFYDKDTTNDIPAAQ